MRSTKVDLDFFRKFCADAYGEGTWAKVELKNIEYGGLHEQTSNIFFSNGIEGNCDVKQIRGDGRPCRRPIARA